MSEDKKWRADDVKRAIAHRHASDMFFTEVKDGPTQIVNHHSRIDALAIKLSWTNFAIIGYEVKVARSDFLRDEKWRAYSPNTAGSIGFELLKKPEIRARIDQAMAERSKRTGINADRVLRELGRIAFLNPKDVIDLNTAEVLGTAVEDDLAVIAGVKVKQTPTEFGTSVEREVKMADKLKALELCGRHLGMFKDNPEGNAPVTVVINYDYGGED
ncbi:MAG: terminase small subunit [Oscillospiraceae bacterium]